MSGVLGKPGKFIGLVEMQPVQPVSGLNVGDVVTFSHSIPWPWFVRAAAFIRGVSLPPRPPVEYRVTDVAHGSTGVERVHPPTYNKDLRQVRSSKNDWMG